GDEADGEGELAPEAHSSVEIVIRALQDETTKENMRDELRRHDHRFTAIALDEILAEIERIGAIAKRILYRPAIPKGIALWIEDAAPRRKRAPLFVHGIAEGIDRIAEPHNAGRMEAEELSKERGPALDLRKFIVFNDIARLSALFEPV